MNPKWSKLDIDELQSESKVWEWSLVLLSMGIDHRIIDDNNKLYIEVETNNLNRAKKEIIQYEKENREGLQNNPTLNESYDFEASFWILISILLFHLVVKNSPFPFFELGCFSSFAIYKGEFWRLVTALFLHRDIAHVLSNLFWEGIFLYFLLKKIPPGMCWFFVLLSGTLGNLINYFVQPINHISIGFSTSVFGTIGIGIGVNIPENLKGAFIFFMCGLGFFSMLGIGGPNVDIIAHFMGLISGLSLGLIIRTFFKFLSNINDLIFWGCFFFIVSISWILVVYYGSDYLLL